MKIITIVSTRPELIRLHKIIKKLDSVLGKDHVFIHTGQNFTNELNDIFYKDLDLRKPNYQFNHTQSTGFKFGAVTMLFIERTLKQFNPKEDKILILGDTNGALYSSIVAKKLGFKIYHMEAGNRCFDDKVPEEVNRKLIDSMSYKLLTYTQRSRENLLQEGYHTKDIIVVGNPIGEIVDDFDNIFAYTSDDISFDNSIQNIIDNELFDLVTFHRRENMEEKTFLNFLAQLCKVAESKKVLLSGHPTFMDKIKEYNVYLPKNIIICKPFNLNQFLYLEKKADVVITDSGTVPEECAIFGTPCILVRTSTERPELLETNNMIVCNPNNFLLQYNNINRFKYSEVPEEYKKQTSDIICKLILGEL